MTEKNLDIHQSRPVASERQVYSRSTIRFEYARGEDHALLVDLLRQAIVKQDVRALVALNEMVTDIRGV